jgi:formylglycine-generating enzyme required for sulfatase activity
VITHIENAPAHLRIKFHLEVFNLQGHPLTPHLTLFFRDAKGGKHLLGAYPLPKLTPSYKLALFNQYLDIPYRSLSASSGAHPLLFDLVIRDAAGKSIASVQKQPLCLVKPAANGAAPSSDCSSPHLLPSKGLSPLQIVEVKHASSSLQFKLNVGTFFGYEGRAVTPQVTFRFRDAKGEGRTIGTYPLAPLAPAHKLQRYDGLLLELPYEKISVSPGPHKLLLDIAFLAPNGTSIAAHSNHALCLIKPKPSSTSPASSLTPEIDVIDAKACTLKTIRFQACRIPAGSFQMGSPEGEEWNNERPQHEVRLSRAFLMLKTEVTQEQYKAVMGYNPSQFRSCGGNCPVENVSWHEAAAFANALSQKQGVEGCFQCNGSGAAVTCEAKSHENYPSCKGWRLPTEAEWEYAARAGTTTARYGELDNIAWYDGNSSKKTHPVGLKEANAWGLHDMLGNVREWTYGWLGRYPTQAATDPVGAATGPDRVGGGSWPGREARGGGWLDNARWVRAAIRNGCDPTDRNSYLGFRVVRSSP